MMNTLGFILWCVRGNRFTDGLATACDRNTAAANVDLKMSERSILLSCNKYDGLLEHNEPS